jgi:Rod binding domain-containing protein
MDQMQALNRIVTAKPLSPAPSEGAAEAERLRSLAAQFEALLLGQMMKEMRSSMFEDDDASGFGGGPLADSMYAELSLALGRAGGLGLADSMMAPLTRQTGPPDEPQRSKNEP